METAAQRDRRERILRAALTLASAGGYEAVQMRAVAEEADVALGTLYRYFPSKVHLLVAATAQEVASTSARLLRRPVPGGTRRERVAHVLDRSSRSLQRDPQLTEALVRATMAADASVATEVSAVRRSMSELIVTALRQDGSAAASDQACAAILLDVWFSRHIAWLGGQVSRADVWRELATAVELVVPA